MYDEIGRDLEGQFKEFPKAKIARWGAAIQTLLHEQSDTPKPLTVGWLASKTGLSEPYLHNVIAGKIKDPPSEKLIKIAEALRVSFPELSMRAIALHEGSIYKTSFGQRGFIEYGQHGFSIQSLVPPGAGERDFFVGIMVVKPLMELKRWRFRTNSVVCMFVESGTIEIIYGDKTILIHANESIYFDGAVTHKLRNVDTVEARLFLVTRPPLH